MKTTNKLMQYNLIIIDESKLDEFTDNFSVDDTVIITIPDLFDKDTMIDYIYNIIIPFMNKFKTLVISTNQKFITLATLLGIDTCFINTGLNDVHSYKTLYEVSNLNKIKDLQLK